MDLSRSMKLFTTLEKSKNFWFLLLTSLGFFFLRLPSLVEPYWYGDEGIYQTMAITMNNGGLLYKDTWDNKPPLLYMLYALFNGDQFSLRFVSLIFGIAAIVIFFFLLKNLFEKHYIRRHEGRTPSIAYGVTILFAFLFGVPLLEGNIANAENFMVALSLLGGYLVLLFTENGKTKLLWYAGTLVSLATLFKIVGIFDFAAFLIFLVLIRYKSYKQLSSEIKEIFPFIIAFLIPFVIVFVYFALTNTLQPFITAAFQDNIGYVGYGNEFIIPQGLLYLKALALFLFVGFLFSKRHVFTQGLLFIYLWFAFSLFNSFFSGRPYTHYLLVLLPSFCLFTALLLDSFLHLGRNAKPIYLQTRFIYTAVFVVIVALTYNKFDVYKKNIAYYQNFIDFMSNKKSIIEYQEFYDAITPSDYAVAQFLRSHTKKNDRVFLWGNSAQVYKMSDTLPPGRYTVAYHITSKKENLQETAKALQEKKPRFIVLMSSQNFPFDLSRYRYAFSIQNRPVYEYNP